MAHRLWSEAERRRFARRHRIRLHYLASVGWCCEVCNAENGTLTPVGDNSFHRVTVELVHRDGNRDNWRWPNLGARCRECRGCPLPPRPAGIERSQPPEPRVWIDELVR